MRGLSGLSFLFSVEMRPSACRRRGGRFRRWVVDKALVGFFALLFFLGCAYAGWLAGRTFPMWILALFFGLAGLALLGSRR